MPKELLEFIRAATAYREFQRDVDTNISVADFTTLVNKLIALEEAQSSTPKSSKDENAVESEPTRKREFNQQAGSYKILSMDGTVTAVEVLTTDLAQVRKNTIELIWPHTTIIFTTEPCEGPRYISQEEFTKLAEFVLQ